MTTMTIPLVHTGVNSNCTQISITVLNDAINKMQKDISNGEIAPPTIQFVESPAVDLFTSLLDKYDISPYDDSIASISHRSTYASPYGSYATDSVKVYLNEFLEEYFEAVLKLVCNKLDDYRIKENK